MAAIASTVEFRRLSPKMIFVVALLTAVFAASVVDVVIPITILDIAETLAFFLEQ